MVLTDELKSHVSVGLSYSAHELRFGYDDEAKNVNERRINRAILNGLNRLFQIQSTYMKGYVSSENVTVRQYRDLLISMAIGKVSRCFQVRDSTYTELTTHSEYMWSINQAEDFWPVIPEYDDTNPLIVDSGFFGPLGSLAFYLYKQGMTGQGLMPLDLITEILSQFWDCLGINYSVTTANQRHIHVLNLIDALTSPFSEWEIMLSRLNQTPISEQPTDAPTYQRVMRQALLNETDWALLKQRLILGEISPEIVPLVDSMVTWASTDSEIAAFYGLNSFELPSVVRDKVADIAPPAGMALVYAAFAVEGYLNAATLLSESSILDTSLVDFKSNVSQNQTKSYVAMQMALSYDAWSALALFETCTEASGWAYRDFATSLDFTLSAGIPVVSESGSTRLLEFNT